MMRDSLAVFTQILAAARVVDLSHTLEEHMPLWPGQSRYFHTLWDSYWHGDHAVDYQLLLNEHTGTHMDAPAHFVRDEDDPAHKWVDQVPVAALMGPARVLDFREIGPDGVVSAEMVVRWERHHVPIRQGDIVLFNMGWAQRWHLRPAGRQYTEHWPSLSTECARFLVERRAQALGTDTLTPDAFGSEDNPVHRCLLHAGVLIIENLDHLDDLPASCVFLGLPLKIKQGSGSPLRAIAVVPEDGSDAVEGTREGGARGEEK
jgi:kynurenine formamidase